ncbi:hypothetical protein [Sphaerobacter sp.]|uniref:dual OB domain-containing protein n=1 Tax=Sphaerobacter sp. TaxID=2099654 RepID=UPI001D40D340|nr:hypothetical protein [Sphaerobacter sp.]MBX5444430.1 hypothetical protein [Sphaerobacter sp.]
MRERLIVTDVAAMDSGVCIAGYVGARSTRPVLPEGGGIPWAYLRDESGNFVEPLTEVEINLLKHTPRPPHTEDRLIDGTGRIRIVRRLPEPEAQSFLRRVCRGSVTDLFGAEIVDRRYILPGQGHSSLGTLRVSRITWLDLDRDEDRGRDQFTLGFADSTGMSYRLRVTDVAFREHCRRTWERTSGRRDLAAIRVRERLNDAEEIFLRIGLSRPFEPGPGVGRRCYLMVTGVYTFPSYLDAPWAEYYAALSELG